MSPEFIAKGLANGVPIGAMLTKDRFAGAFVPGAHASTFGGNPLATAAAVSVLNAIEQENLLDNCLVIGGYLLNRLKELQKGFDFIKEVCGMGLLIGMELTFDAGDIVKRCMDKGILINYTNGNVLRFIPPLIVTEDEIDVLIKALEEIFMGIEKK